MKQIGFLYGDAHEFPKAVINRINQKRSDIKASSILLNQLTHSDLKSPYDLVIDYISHLVPFYQTYLKALAITGTKVYNNPFNATSYDRYYQIAQAARLGLHVPKTSLLPSYHRPAYTNEASFANLAYPFDWQSIVQTVGLPAFLKINNGPTNAPIYKVTSLADLWQKQAIAGNHSMILQECITTDTFYSCFSIGKHFHNVLAYQPHYPIHLRYATQVEMKEEMKELLISQATRLNEALGLVFNRVQFAVRDETPYVIDTDPFVDTASIYRLGPDVYEWLIESSALWAIDQLDHPKIKSNRVRKTK